MASIKLQNNTATEVTFKYGNCTRNESRDNPGEYYYTFDCEEGKLHANPALCAAIATSWVGRGGKAEIEKLNATRYEVKRLLNADTIYDLEMKVWNNDIRKFDTVDFEILGLDGNSPTPAPTQEAPPASEKPTGEPSKPTATSTATTELSIEYLRSLMAECIEAATVINPEEWTPAEAQKVAVTIYMDARRAGIVPEAMKVKPEELSIEYLRPDTDDLPF